MSLAREITEKIVKEKEESITNEKSHSKIISTLLEINQAYPEVRDRLRDTPQWKNLSEIEQEINRAALEDNFEGLDRALQAYKQAVLTVEGTGGQGNLFGGVKG
jgi:rRNA maturation endonuclease Nob1